LAQRVWQRGTRDECAPERGRVLPGFGRGIEQNLQVIRRAEIAARLEMRDRLELLLGIAGAGGDDRTTQRMRARLHDEAAGGEMIGKGIVHDVARAEARGERSEERRVG